MQEIEQLLRQATGLDTTALGPRLIERVVRQRMRVACVSSVEDYLRLIQRSGQQWNELVEAVVVTETWFFRDREAFSVCARLLESNGDAPPHRGKVRVLSLPCASGEEPYSLAMALSDAGVLADRYELEGVDISARALDRARQAVYGANSFRGRELAFRRRHFRVAGREFVLEARIRDRVGFYTGNLLSDDFVPRQPAYDFIFCRNLMIYFDRATQREAFDRLRRLLAPGGILFLGPAEMPLATQNGFAAAHAPRSFGCRRADDCVLPALRPGPVHASTETATLSACAEVDPKPHAASGRRGVEAPAPDLAMAQKLADAGKLEEAAEICHAYLRRCGASANAYYLLGLVHDAASHPQAAECYRKAVYLEPGHHDALSHLALLSRKNGNLAQARALQRRADRARQTLREES